MPEFRQQGASLVLGLLLVLVISLLTLVNARASLSQYQALQAGLDARQAFQAADSALRKSSRWLLRQLRDLPCQPQCPAPEGTLSGNQAVADLIRHSDDWWRSRANQWYGGQRLVYLQASETILELDPRNGSLQRWQREIYSSYIYQRGSLPGNRVLLHELWLVDRPADHQDFPGCIDGARLRAALSGNEVGLCGRLGWEQLRP